MIINCGDRRIVSYQYGWKLERRCVYRSGKRKGQEYWTEDNPAYPSSLASALEMVYERTLKDEGEVHVKELVQTCKDAAHKVRQYARQVREAV